MTTKFYWGDYTNFGHPTAIMSDWNDATHYYVQAFIIFESTHPFFDELNWKMEIPDPILGISSDMLLKFMLTTEIPNAVYKYIVSTFGVTGGTVQSYGAIQFSESDALLIRYIRDKFPEYLSEIEKRAVDPSLKSLIGTFKSIVVTQISNASPYSGI